MRKGASRRHCSPLRVACFYSRILKLSRKVTKKGAAGSETLLLHCRYNAGTFTLDKQEELVFTSPAMCECSLHVEVVLVPSRANFRKVVSGQELGLQVARLSSACSVLGEPAPSGNWALGGAYALSG